MFALYTYKNVNVSWFIILFWFCFVIVWPGLLWSPAVIRLSSRSVSVVFLPCEYLANHLRPEDFSLSIGCCFVSLSIWLSLIVILVIIPRFAVGSVFVDVQAGGTYGSASMLMYSSRYNTVVAFPLLPVKWGSNCYDVVLVAPGCLFGSGFFLYFRVISLVMLDFTLSRHHPRNVTLQSRVPLFIRSGSKCFKPRRVCSVGLYKLLYILSYTSANLICEYYFSF